MTDEEHREWLTPRLCAQMWWCGDEECDCTQPIVERITPNLNAGYPWIRRERLWEGTFHSDYYHELGMREQQEAELREAAARYGIELNEDLFGVRPVAALAEEGK